MSEAKQDYVDRKIEGVVKLAKLDSVKVMLIISVLFNIYQYVDNRSLNSKIVDEVRRQVPRAVEEQVPAVVDSKLEGVKEGVDKALNKVDTIVQRIGGRE